MSKESGSISKRVENARTCIYIELAKIRIAGGFKPWAPETVSKMNQIILKPETSDLGPGQLHLQIRYIPDEECWLLDRTEILGDVSTNNWCKPKIVTHDGVALQRTKG
jgi:hypothetical protein